MAQTYQYSKMLTRSQTTKNNNTSNINNNNVRRSPRFSSNVYSNITFEIKEHDESVRTSNKHSNNLDENEVVIRRSTRLANNERSNNLDENEGCKVLRRSQRLASKPVPSFYKDIDQFFELDNDEDDEDYTPKTELSVDIDFDEASRAWRQNKRPLGNGMFSYNTRSKTKV
jgi:hypothetical protein